MIGVALKELDSSFRMQGVWLNLVLGGLSGDISAIGYVTPPSPNPDYTCSCNIRPRTHTAAAPSVRAGPAQGKLMIWSDR